MGQARPDTQLSPEAARVIAQAMMQISACDGVHPREVAMIQEFLHDCGGPEVGAYEALLARPLDIDEARWVLSSQGQREVLLQSCLLLSWADGRVSEAEQQMMAALARDLEVPEERLQRLETSVKSFMVHRYAAVAPEEAAEAMGRDMGLPERAIARALGQTGLEGAP